MTIQELETRIIELKEINNLLLGDRKPVTANILGLSVLSILDLLEKVVKELEWVKIEQDTETRDEIRNVKDEIKNVKMDVEWLRGNTLSNKILVFNSDEWYQLKKSSSIVIPEGVKKILFWPIGECEMMVVDEDSDMIKEVGEKKADNSQNCFLCGNKTSNYKYQFETQRYFGIDCWKEIENSGKVITDYLKCHDCGLTESETLKQRRGALGRYENKLICPECYRDFKENN